MPRTTTTTELICFARKVGIKFSISDTPAELYAIVDSPASKLLYIGTNQSADGKRGLREASWGGDDPDEKCYSGLVSLIHHNKGHHVYLRFDGFDKERAIAIGKAYQAGLVEDLEQEDFALSVLDLEAFLIRTCVRLGVPVANSTHSSQFEGPIGTVADCLAYWAVTSSPSTAVPA